jgi:4-amino-4-deoxy-L-arabinose transferase-like glycosyltransferase
VTRRDLWTILAIAALVRVFFALAAWLATKDLLVFHYYDTLSYLYPAYEMSRRGGFAVDGVPELIRTPGYPLFLLPGFWLGAPEVTTVVLQIALSVATVAGVFTLARQLFTDRRIAIAAALLYALEPLSVEYSAKLMTETLFSFGVVWALVGLTDYVRRGRVVSLAASAALLAGAIYVRPAGYYLPFGLFALLAGIAAFARRWDRVAHAALGAGVVIALIAPWHLRNRALEFRGFSAITAVNMYFYNAAALRTGRNGMSFAATQLSMGYPNDTTFLAIHPEQKEWSPGRRFEWLAAEGRREVLAEWPRFLGLHVAGMARVLVDPGVIDPLKMLGLYPDHGGLRNVVLSRGLFRGFVYLLRENALAFGLLFVFGAVLAATYWLAFQGARGGPGLRDSAMLLVLATTAYLVVITGGPVGVSRFRHPVMPFLCVLAAAGLVRTRWFASTFPLSRMGEGDRG